MSSLPLIILLTASPPFYNKISKMQVTPQKISTKRSKFLHGVIFSQWLFNKLIACSRDLRFEEQEIPATVAYIKIRKVAGVS